MSKKNRSKIKNDDYNLVENLKRIDQQGKSNLSHTEKDVTNLEMNKDLNPNISSQNEDLQSITKDEINYSSNNNNLYIENRILRCENKLNEKFEVKLSSKADKNDIQSLKDKLESKLGKESLTTYKWVFGIIMTLFLASLGFIINSLTSKVNSEELNDKMEILEYKIIDEIDSKKSEEDLKEDSSNKKR